MANITIITSANTITAKFNDYSTLLERTEGCWRKENISFHNSNNFIEVNIVGEKTWFVSFNGNSMDTPTFQIDSIDGISPIDMQDLFDKLKDNLN